MSAPILPAPRMSTRCIGGPLKKARILLLPDSSTPVVGPDVRQTSIIGVIWAEFDGVIASRHYAITRNNLLAQRQLADPRCPATAYLQRYEGAGAGRRPPLQAAPHRGFLGDRRTSRAAGSGATGTGLPSSGRRLRGDLCGL